MADKNLQFNTYCIVESVVILLIVSDDITLGFYENITIIFWVMHMLKLSIRLRIKLYLSYFFVCPCFLLATSYLNQDFRIIIQPIEPLKLIKVLQGIIMHLQSLSHNTSLNCLCKCKVIKSLINSFHHCWNVSRLCDSKSSLSWTELSID